MGYSAMIGDSLMYTQVDTKLLKSINNNVTILD